MTDDDEAIEGTALEEVGRMKYFIKWALDDD
jgi:hypothetical protein